MNEQQKVAALYEKLPPEKKAVFKAMMQTICTMIVAMTATANEQKGGTSCVINCSYEHNASLDGERNVLPTGK